MKAQSDLRKTIISRIKKCFALSKSCNEHEAAVALGKARKLMGEYNVSKDELLASEASESTARSGAKRRPPSWEAKLADNVCKTFGCHKIYLPAAWSDYKGRWAFMGCGPGPEIAKYAFDVLIRQARKARSSYIKSHLKQCKATTKIRRADIFCLGWTNTASSSVPKLAVSEENNRSIQAFFNERYPQTRDLSPIERCKSKHITGKLLDDFIQGRRAGENSILDHGVAGMSSAETLFLGN